MWRQHLDEAHWLQHECWDACWVQDSLCCNFDCGLRISTNSEIMSLGAAVVCLKNPGAGDWGPYEWVPFAPQLGHLRYMDVIFPYFSIFSWSKFGNRFKHMHDVLCWQEFLNIDPLLSSCAAKWCLFAFLQVEDVLKAAPQWQYHVKVGNMLYIPCMGLLSLLCGLLMHLMHTTYVRYIWFRIHSTSFYIF